MEQRHEGKAACQHCRDEWIAVVLHDAERHMHHDEPVGGVKRHVQSLPDRWRQEDEPIVMAGRRHQEQDEERDDAQRLEGKADELAVVGKLGQLVVKARQRVLDRVPLDHERGVHEGDEEGQHAEMTPVVQHRQETAIEARQRPDRKNDRQHEECAAAEGADAQIDRGRQILGWVEPMGQDQIAADVERHADEQDAVVNELRPVPLHGAKRGTHGLSSSAARGGSALGGGRNVSAIAKPSATAKARTGQSRRCTDRCDRVMATISANG